MSFIFHGREENVVSKQQALQKYSMNVLLTLIKCHKILNGLQQQNSERAKLLPLRSTTLPAHAYPAAILANGT